MKKFISLGIAFLVLMLLATLMVLPVCGVETTTTSSLVTGATATKPFISATVSSSTPTVGEPVTISGVATGGNLNYTGVQIWVFAGNFVDITTERIMADGTFSKTFPTTGRLPATYYVFVQSPGTDGKHDIRLNDAGKSSGQVVNTRTKATIFNFTGTGSVQDAAALKALSDALNQPGQDDAYTSLTFKLTSHGDAPETAKTIAAAPGATNAPASAPTAKSPMPVEVTAGALVISGCCAAFCMRKIH